jgi:hypothetical protein
VRPLLGEVTAIDNQHARGGITQARRHQLLVFGQHGGVIPGTNADALRHRLHVAPVQRVGHRRNRLPLERQQLPLRVLERPVPLFRAAEERGACGMVGPQLVVQRHHFLRRHAEQGRAG